MITPQILWAENSEIIILTVDVLNSEQDVITLTEKNLTLKGISEESEYLVDIELFDSIDSDRSYWKINKRNIEFTLYKKNLNVWGKLTCKKYHNIKTDWHRWNNFNSDVESEEEYEDNTHDYEFNPQTLEDLNINDEIDDEDLEEELEAEELEGEELEAEELDVDELEDVLEEELEDSKEEELEAEELDAEELELNDE